MICGPFSLACLLAASPCETLAAFRRHGYDELSGTTPSRLLSVARELDRAHCWRLGFGSPAPLARALPQQGIAFVRCRAVPDEGHVVAVHAGQVYDCLMPGPLSVADWAARTEFDELFASVTASGTFAAKWWPLKKEIHHAS